MFHLIGVSCFSNCIQYLFCWLFCRLAMASGIRWMIPSYLPVILDRYSVNKHMFSFISGIVRKTNFQIFCYVISVHLINIFKFSVGLFLKQQLDGWESKGGSSWARILSLIQLPALWQVTSETHAEDGEGDSHGQAGLLATEASGRGHLSARAQAATCLSGPAPAPRSFLSCCCCILGLANSISGNVWPWTKSHMCSKVFILIAKN